MLVQRRLTEIREEAIEAILEFGRHHPRGDLNIKELIDEGRRY